MELRNSKKKGVPAQQAERSRRARAPEGGAQAHATSPSREEQQKNKRVRSKPPCERPSRRQRRAGEAGPSTASREAPGTDTPACVEPEAQAPPRPVKKEPKSRSVGPGDPARDRAPAMAGNSADEERTEQVRKLHKPTAFATSRDSCMFRCAGCCLHGAVTTLSCARSTTFSEQLTERT